MSATSPISSSATEQRPQVSPFRLFQAINAYQLTDAIRSAIELDVFTAIGAGQSNPVAVARQCGIAERGARMLCDFLVVHGFLTKSGQEYALADAPLCHIVGASIPPDGYSFWMASGKLRRVALTSPQRGSNTQSLFPAWFRLHGLLSSSLVLS